MKPVLVSMSGDKNKICELLGMETADSYLIKNKLSPDEILYLNTRYPEYLGAIPAIVAKIASVGVGIGKSIADMVKQRREQKKQLSAQKTAEEQAKVAQYQYQQALVYQQRNKQKSLSDAMLIGIPAMLLLYFALKG